MAVDHFKGLNLTGITEGMGYLDEFYEDLKPTLKSCKKLTKIFTKFKALSNPLLLAPTLAYNLLWYFSDIKDNISDAL